LQNQIQISTTTVSSRNAFHIPTVDDNVEEDYNELQYIIQQYEHTSFKKDSQFDYNCILYCI